MSFKERIDIRYGNEIGSPEKDNDYQPKAKHNKMAKNIFALD